jgi:hypothetical protein
MKMNKAGVGVGMVTALLVVGTWLGGTGVATATLPMQKKAKALGFPANNCQYCHVEKLPKKGASTNNDRGQWLHEEALKRKAKEADPAWLKDYVEKKAGESK